MKKLLSFLLATVLCLSLAACSKLTGSEGNKQENSQEIHIRIKNTVEEQVAGLGATWYIGDKAIGSTGMEAADGEEIGDSVIDFVLTRDDIPDGSDLKEFGVKFRVTEKSGESFDVCDLRFPVEFGESYAFKLKNEDGCYAVWLDMDSDSDVPPVISTPAISEDEQKTDEASIELVGPWHLDDEKNDLSAFADIFPAYAEFGASMEIKSNGQMSWYIGAAGGVGTYTQEGETLHADLLSDVEQKDMPMDFNIVVKDETAMLEMEYQDMTVYWVYGDSEDAPAWGEAQ